MSTITIGKFVYKHYIDRDALLDFANNHKDGQIGCNDIARFPSADVVEVVRCKDCKFWDECGFCYNDKWRDVEGWEQETNGQDFCSYGERKEN